MRIAMLAPIAWRTPPRHYGPWELLTHLLTEELVALGVDVTLFATKDSQTSARLDAVVPAPYSEDPSIDPKVWEYRHLSHVFSKAGEFDIIHNQSDFPTHAFTPLVETPVVTTIHGFSSERILPMYKPFEDQVHFVAISEADRHLDLRYAATIHHGIKMEYFPFDPVGSEDLLFFGRIHPDKGTKDAIEVARATGHRLHIYGIIQDQAYFDAHVRPHLSDGQILWHGPVGGIERAKALGAAKALLHLIGFDEPFGLSVVEAMACGTPVIAYPRGSMPELIRDGQTGFLVDTLAEAIRAVEQVNTLDRATARARVAAHFTTRRMARDYLALYQSVLAARS
ncbi:glycosyltransferase family 4 protein [Celeribacter sp.]|uniref:glycosyltransferase family 4 protein n=1 Tax=Celeribacter sp. TaxID=1890673 RepID=UPI003A90DE53